MIPVTSKNEVLYFTDKLDELAEENVKISQIAIG